MGSLRMPVWLEILLNVIGYGGFIALAIYHKPPRGKLPDKDANGG